MALIENIINEDGTKYNPPLTADYRWLKKKYPECDLGPDYRCMFCNKCLLGEYFKPADDYEKQILINQSNVRRNYLLEHNPSLRKILRNNGE